MRLKSLLVAATAGTVLLAGCTPPQTYNPNDPNQRTRSGAAIGAGAGALLGVLTGKGGKDKLDRAVVGGVIGAGAGAIVGNILDKQAAELQRDITTDGVRIINQGDRLIVSLPEGILFPVDSASVNPGIMGDLNTVAASLNRYPNSSVEVVGHTDNTGSAAYNQDLSQRRASAVSGILQQNGVSGARIVPYGRGESQPVASNLTPEGRAQNRRVEIIIIPNG
ncbi:MAG: OmpA family protein [Albidovulum sp.]|jgi:outer membrane protein OmpA-like peptidoglycan-associated protein